MAPITTLAISLLEIVPLHIGGPLFVGGAIVTGSALLLVVPGDRRPVATGLLAGLLAVGIYDCTRMPFVIIGNWPDFIPKIGVWLLNEPDTHWSVGYAWRYLGNGAGMGLAFAMAVPHLDHLGSRRRIGPIYGAAIWAGLISTVLLSPDGQGKMFVLTPLTLAVSLTGHLVYGSVLGFTLERVDTEIRPFRLA